MTTPPVPPIPPEGAPRVIDAKFPVTWLIGSAASIVFALGGLYVQLNGVIAVVAKMEAKTDLRDERYSVMNQALLLVQGDNRVQQTEINQNKSEIVEIKRRLDEQGRKQTWAPK